MQYITPLCPSTLTAQGKLTNAQFMDVDDILYQVYPTGRINKIICNFGDINNPTWVDTPIKVKTTNRGRKKKVKENKNNRQNRGNGNCFSSQCSMYIQSDVLPTKQYKVKIFKTGTFEVPGGLEPSMRDIYSAMVPIEDALSEMFQEEVKIDNLHSLMRNYKFRIIDESKKLRLKNIYSVLRNIKENQKLHPVEDAREVISDVKYVVERYQGLIIKFKTPIMDKPNKKTTIKLFASGKINIDGAISEESAQYYYEWVDRFFVENDRDDHIMYIPMPITEQSDSDSEDEAE